MPDRSVTYTFRGNFTNLAAGLTAAGRNVTELGVKMTALDRNGAKMRAGLTATGSAAGKLGLVAAAGVGVFIASAARFDSAMSNVQAATHETAGNMQLLREAAIKAGADTVYSASEAAGAIEELAKAGVSTKDILGGGLSGALSLAAAGGLDVADAAGIAAIAMQQFKLSGDQIPHVADLLAAGAGKAMGSVDDLGMALKQSGLVADQMGLSIEETTGTLSAFASAGLLGSDAGTSFKTMLQALTPNSQQAADKMQELGLQFYDAQGQFVGLQSVAGQLQAALGGLSEEQRNAALKTIFGADAVRAATVLYQQGASGVADWTAKVNDQGYAAETAAKRLDNLSGDLEQLKGSLETAFIGAGEGAQGPLRQLVQGTTDLVNVFNKLPQSGKNAATGVLALTAVTGGGLWFTSKVVQGVADTRKALDDLGISATRTGAALRGLGMTGGAALAIIGISEAAGELIKMSDKAAPGVEHLTKSLLGLQSITGIQSLAADLGDLKGSIDALSDPGMAAQAFSALDKVPLGAGSFLQRVTPGLDAAGQKAREAASDINALDEALVGIVSAGSPERARDTFAQLAQAYGLTADEQKVLLGLLPQYQEALDGAANAATLGADANRGYGVSARQSAQASDAEAAAIADATKAMQDKRTATLAAFDAETNYRQALKDATEQGKKSNAGIKGSTDEALANRAALSQLAAAWNNQSAAVRNNEERFRSARQAFMQTAQAMGVSEKAAKALADRVLEIPKSRVIDTDVKVQAALSAIDRLKLALSNIRDEDVNVRIHYLNIGNKMAGLAASGAIPGNAGGGLIRGPGGPRDDQILTRLSNREYVVQAEAVDHYGVGFMDAINARRFATGGYTGSNYASVGAGGTPAFALVDPANAAANALNNLAASGKKELEARAKLLQKEVDRDQEAVDLAKQHRDAVLDDIKSLRESVANRFKSDLFGQQAPDLNILPDNFNDLTPEQQREWLQTQYQVRQSMTQSPIDILNQDIAQGEEANKLYRRLARIYRRSGGRMTAAERKALTYAQLNASNPELAALIADPVTAQRYADLYGRRERVAGRAGNTAAMQRWGKAQERAVDELVAAKAELRASNAELKQVNQRLHHLEQLAEKNPKDTGDHVKKSFDHVGAQAGRRR